MGRNWWVFGVLVMYTYREWIFLHKSLSPSGLFYFPFAFLFFPHPPPVFIIIKYYFYYSVNFLFPLPTSTYGVLLAGSLALKRRSPKRMSRFYCHISQLNATVLC